MVGITYAAQPGKQTTFAYDGFGRRTAITTTLSGSSSTTFYQWCGSRLCQALNSNGAIARAYFDEGEVVAASGTGLYYGPDRLGSVRDVAAVTGSSITPQFYNYDPYGNPIQIPTGALTDFRYAGMFYHADSGLYLTRYRAYDPRTARWLSRDPIGERGGANLYAYVEGNPVNYIDPSGLLPPGVAGALGGALGGLLGQLFQPDPNSPDPNSCPAGPGPFPPPYMQSEGNGNDPTTTDQQGSPTTADPGPPPSAPVGNSNSPIEIQPGTNSPANIDGTDYSGHVLDRAQGRGIPPSVVQDSINNGQSAPGNQLSTTTYYSPANKRDGRYRRLHRDRHND